MENNLSKASSSHGPPDKDSDSSEVKPVIKTETWMSSLPSTLHNLPLTKLTIPDLKYSTKMVSMKKMGRHGGSRYTGTGCYKPAQHNWGRIDKWKQTVFAAKSTHDSGTFSCCTTLAPDADRAIKLMSEIPHMGSFVNNVIQRWAQCQRLNFSQQLLSGIRYFDLRVSTKPDSDEFFLVHTVYAAKVSELVQAVKSFVDSYSHEIVILDFNHFYAMDEEHHVQLITYLIAEFGHTICHRCDIDDLTLSTLWEKGCQVIIFYQHKVVEPFEEIWPKQHIYSFWPNTDNPKTCIERLDKFFNTKDPQPDTKHFVVCQGILTPTTATITESIFCTEGMETLNKKLSPAFSDWIEKSVDFTCSLNIVIADFVRETGLILRLIDLNYERVLSK